MPREDSGGATAALILAAGRGSRMGPATQARPKCLVELLGQPLIRWQTEALTAGGIRDVSAIGGYLADAITAEVPLAAVNLRWQETNMVATLTCAGHLLAHEPYIVSYSDIVYHPDIVATLRHAEGDIAITYDRNWLSLWQSRFDDPLSDAETFRHRNGKLIEIGRRASNVDEIEGQYMGLLRFTPTGWNHVETTLAKLSLREVNALDMTGLLQRLLDRGFPISVIPVDGGWCEVDSESDVENYTCRIASAAAAGSRWSHDWRFGD